MSFFKYHNYNTPNSNINFTYENGGLIFNVGQKEQAGLITLLKENGNLVWNKEYTYPNREITFKKIMPVSGNYVILGLEDQVIPFLLCIDPNGEVLWHKDFPGTPSEEDSVFAEVFDDRVYMVYFDSKYGNSYITAISSKGDMIASKIIKDPSHIHNIKVTGLTIYNETILICGNDNGLGIVISTNMDLTLTTSKLTYLQNGASVAIDGVHYQNNNVYACGLWNNAPLLILMDQHYGYLYKQNTGVKTHFTFGKNNFYVYNEKNEIAYSNYNHSIEFIKKLDVRTSVIDQIDGDKVLIHGTADAKAYSGYIQNDINNCKSSPLQIVQPDLYEVNIKGADFVLTDLFIPTDEAGIKMSPASYSNDDVCDTGGSSIEFNEFSGLQRPDFYLQAAGSEGNDSAKGIHLRWSFGGKLGENHLPKGNNALTTYNFNKPDDFVKIYRTPYVKSVFTLDFATPPQLIDDTQKMWVYKFNNNTRIIYVYFKNKDIYTQVRQSINPLTNPLQFIEKYGNQIIEVKCNTDIFFAASVKVNNQQSGSTLELEALSVSEPNSSSQQYLSYRKSYYGSEISATNFNAENGKTLRFRADNCFARLINLEFYSDFIVSRNNENAWKLQGEFSLSTDENEAFTRLEPLPDTNPVHGAWLRYNDEAFVNIDNYKKKWQHSAQNPLDRDILTVIEKYIELSNKQPNPKAYETINFNLAASDANPLIDITNNAPEDGETQVSNLDILNIAALDYHVARMLGLGHLDIKDDVLGKEFIYIAEYFTNKNVDINNSDKSYQLLSMSLPVATNIERLSLPVDLMKLEKGMGANNPNSSGLYDGEGYSHNGKYRYISMYNKQIPDYQVNPVFFDSYYKFDASQFTNPVYAGLEHRLVEPGGVDNYIWKKPELSHDSQYLNIDVANGSLETLPIQIPDTYVPMYMHRQDKSGTYYYKGYGINWFSRAQISDNELSIVTEIKPKNKLLPPSAITAFNIQKEVPLTFTSLDEQDRLKAIGAQDKTLVRLTFDYHIYQDEIGYSIPFDSGISDLYDPNAVFPDNKEVFADDVEIYYRNYTPKIISAQIIPNKIYDHQSNQLLAIIETRDYSVPGSGQPLLAPGNNQPFPQPSIQPDTFKSKIPAGTTASDFIGGIFLMDSETYIINEITQGANGLIFTVFKKAASAAIMAGTTPLIDQASLVLPVVNPATEGLFYVTENMQNTPTWGVKNPNSLKVKIGTNDWEVHREVISTPQSSGTPQQYLEKSRGFWKNARIERQYEKIAKYQNSLGTVINDPAHGAEVHQGVYKLTFPGFKMAQHTQFSSNSDSVEWLNGIVRLFTVGSIVDGIPVESRSIFKVVRTENIDSGQDLILYIYDENFIIKENGLHLPIFDYSAIFDTGTEVPEIPEIKPTDPILGKNVLVNYYPSYRVYLYKNVANNLIEEAILPEPDEDVRYSIFGLKSVDNDNLDLQGAKYKSKFSFPVVMFANRIVEPKKPRQPKGSKYATRPDKFGKSTYSFTTQYEQKPYSVQFFRANNTLLLGALYEPKTIQKIKIALDLRGGNEEAFFNDRWMNFVDFDMLGKKESNGYERLPKLGRLGYSLPLPDSKEFFTAIDNFIEGHNKHYGYDSTHSDYIALLTPDDNRLKRIGNSIIPAVTNKYDELRFGHFIRERIFNCFLPLTEVPMIYQHIHNLDLNSATGHRPKNKKQNIRDASGYLLPATHADFDMAPMAAIYSQTPMHSTLFTDFTLDGASDNFYFYGVRELGNQMQMGEFSTFLGPIKLVNTNPAEPAKILSLLPVVENATLGITAKVRIEVNPYPEVQKINKVSVYRATNKLDADSILSMQHIKTLDIEDIEIDEVNKSWVVYDEFDDLADKPYGDLLFYRVVVSRKVEYSTTNYEVMPPASQVVVEQAPSLPSKVIVSTLVENYNPSSPELRYHSEPVVSDFIDTVILSWDQVCYKGKYHLYKLNNQGNWKEVARINTDRNDKSKAHLSVFGNNPATNTEEWIVKETFDMTLNEFFLPLEKLNMDPMQIKDADGNMLYHHFKMMAENTSNMLSTEEKILTIYKEETWSDIGGISSDGLDGMILQGTFIVRPN